MPDATTVMTPVPPLTDPKRDRHDAYSRRLLEEAAQMLATGDRVQASEKMWGAVVHRLKVIAAERNWPYKGHDDGIMIARYLGRESGNPQIKGLTESAAALHQNFYEDARYPDELAEDLDGTRELISMLTAAHEALRADLDYPTYQRYRRWHNLPLAAD